MRKILSLLTLTTVIVSCQTGGDNPHEPTQKRVTISPVITLPANSAITRATELSFEEGDEIGVTIVKKDGTAHAENASMTFKEGVFNGDVAWYEGMDASKIIAYYPRSNNGVPTSFSVSTDQTNTGYEMSDLMGAVKADAVPTNDAVSVTFKHLLSKIIFNVNQTDEEIRSVVLQNSIPTAIVDLEKLTVTADPTVPAADIKAQTVSTGSVYRAVIVPQTVALTVVVATTEGKNYTHKLSSTAIKNGGQYSANVEIVDGELKVRMSGEIENWANGDEIENGIDPNPQGATAYITKVFDYMPAVGQFTNEMPQYEAGDTRETMNAKVLATIGNNAKGTITLGGWGGYVTVGFDHTIANVTGKRDFRVIANAFYAAANPDPNAPIGGSCEPGVIMVAYDADKDGGPDDDEWYEIAGSAHKDPTKELWYQMAVDNGNDVNLYRDYSITYHRPEAEPASNEEWATYIRWEDNKGNSGYKVKNEFHEQPYYPLWAGSTLTFNGTRLPENAIDESGKGTYFVLYKFHYGYADNVPNTDDEAAIDIDWAVDADGNKADLPGVDFIKIYTGVNQENGWLGENSTEIMGVEDLHVLGVDIPTRQ
jgi:hypothetical protein